MYGCSILRVVDATSLSPARRWKSAASESLNGRRRSCSVCKTKLEPCYHSLNINAGVTLTAIWPLVTLRTCGRLAQLVRVLARHARGQWFESTTAHHSDGQPHADLPESFTRDFEIYRLGSVVWSTRACLVSIMRVSEIAWTRLSYLRKRPTQGFQDSVRVTPSG